MNYYPFHVGDYNLHTMHLTHTQDIAYRRMIDWCFTHEAPLPKDPKIVARLIRMNDCLTDVEQVLNEFFNEAETGYINKRVVEEINAYYLKKKQQSDAGKASAEARKNGKQRPSNGRSTNQNQNQNQNIYTPEFENMWGIYPKRNTPHNKSQALKAWNARIAEGVSPDEIIRGVKNYAAECQKEGRTGTQFVKQAATFLGPNKHYGDYQEEIAPSYVPGQKRNPRDYT